MADLPRRMAVEVQVGQKPQPHARDDIHDHHPRRHAGSNLHAPDERPRRAAALVAQTRLGIPLL
ncbi:hypothetical protein, partial [Microbacterium sp. GbtcB4]|uniref:hypothetical protein n=1 Tax=Microbacterium sp. GbtcB4 TaxID=2824749 RepID=UPI001C2F3423